MKEKIQELQHKTRKNNSKQSLIKVEKQNNQLLPRSLGMFLEILIQKDGITPEFIGTNSWRIVSTQLIN